MQTPPFRIARPASPLLDLHRHHGEPGSPPATGDAASEVGTATTGRSIPAEATGRGRFGSMDPHLHCSVIGTCLSTAELRKAMARFIVVEGASDLDVHHEAVRLAQRPDIAHALNKLLDRKHDAMVQRFGRIRDVDQLAGLWQEAVRSGEVPGAYWAVLTHRRVTDALRQQVFGDVHMLSHLVGAANRADIRRLVAIEQENSELQQRNLRQQARIDELARERDHGLAEAQRQRARAEDLELALSRAGAGASRPADALQQDLADVIAVQAQRREAAEAKAQAQENETTRLSLELEKAREHIATLAHELAIAEGELRRGSSGDGDAQAASPFTALQGRRLLYVGGRPSSSAAIRDFVLRHGAEYQRHDGGIEDRKGLLAPAIAWADLVVFPVDCIDHDSALQLKRQCTRQATTWLPLRSASLTSLATAIASLPAHASEPGPQSRSQPSQQASGQPPPHRSPDDSRLRSD